MSPKKKVRRWPQADPDKETTPIYDQVKKAVKGKKNG